MFIELNPGTGSARIAKPGYVIPVSNTNPDVNLDEVLSSLDGDTRAYLDLLVNGGAQGLQGRGNDLAGVLQRFEPTHRDLARVAQAVAVRGVNLRRLVNSLQRLNTALAAKRGELIQLVDSSSSVFRALASEDQNISRAVADLPGTLRQTTSTLTKVQTFANQLGPTAANLIRPPTTRSPRSRNRAPRSSATRSARSSSTRVRWCATSARRRSTSRRRPPTSAGFSRCSTTC
jgi:phospholipid/cholesterol/gamma-HCH transport system substrate-binding protein